MKNDKTELLKKAISEGLSNKIDKIREETVNVEITFPKEDKFSKKH